MKKLLFMVVLVASAFHCVSQNNTVNSNLTAQQLANHILGFGVDLVSATYTGDPNSNGIFTTSGLPQMSDGIILSTGAVNNDIFLPPNYFNSHLLNRSGDADLLSLYNSAGYDAASLEVVIRPRGNKLTFKYIFASEEYLGYECQVNDMFALLIKPESSTGPYTNIALVPGTNYPISINTIHGFNTPCNGYPQSYKEYYSTPNSGDSFAFNGRTVLLTAEYTVNPCQLYKLKFVVHDLIDAGFNSAIYIKANSLNSTGVTISNNQANLINGVNHLITQCQTDTINIKRNAGITGDLDISIIKTGTAKIGLDYLPIVDSFKLLSTEQQFNIPIVPVGSQSIDKNLVLKFYRKLPSCGTGTDLIFIDSVVYNFKNLPKPNGLQDVTICNTGIHQINISNTYGFDSIKFTPHIGLNDYNNFNPIFIGNSSQTYYVNLYKNGCIRQDTFTINRATTSAINNITDSICASSLPYSWMGKSVNSIGTHTLIDTALTTQGCDSLTILTLKVFSNPSNVVINQTFCQQDLPLNWNGNIVQSIGTHSLNFTKPSVVTGCDSTTILNLTVHTTKTHTVYDTICQSALPYLWNDIIINESGNHTANYNTTSLITGCDSVTTLKLVVVPKPIVMPINNQLLCNNAPTHAINFISFSAGATITYNWTNNNTAIGLAASGAGNIPSFNATNTTNSPITATITVTPTANYGNNSCIGTPMEFTITVNPAVTVNDINNQYICAGSATSAINFSSPTTGGTIIYNWTNSNTAIGLAASGTGNIPSFTTTNTTNAPISATITVTPSYTAQGVTCMGTPKTFTIIVNPTATVASILDQSLCAGESATPINFASPTTGGTIAYNWTNNNTAIGLPASGNDSIPSFIATNTTNIPITATITVTPSYNANGLTCTGTPQLFTITINPIASVNPINNQQLCVGASATPINFSSPTTGGTVSYSWNNNDTTIGLGASGTGNIPSFIATNTSNAPITATITVTPIYTANGISCTGSPRIFTITVNPTATVDTISDQNVCVGDMMPGVNFTCPTLGGTVAYTWTNNNTAIGLAASGSGNLPSFLASNSTNTPLVATINVTPIYTANNIICTGTTMLFNINVNPYPHVDLGQDIVSCINQGDLQFLNARNQGANYLWDNNYNGQVRVVDQSGHYWVAVTNQWGCTTIDTIQVTLNLNPTVVIGNDTTVCIGTNLNLDAGTGGISYIWSTGATTATTQATQPGIYTVAVIGANGCIQTDSINIEHEGLYPKHDGIRVRNTDKYTFKFQIKNPTNTKNYAWDFGDGSPLSYENEPVHTFPTVGSYLVRLHLQSDCGSIEDTATVHIFSHTDIADLDEDIYKINIYPVPARDKITITADKNVLIQKIMLTNQLGQIVKIADIKIPTTEVLMNIAELAAANYTVQIITNKGVLNKTIAVVK